MSKVNAQLSLSEKIFLHTLITSQIANVDDQLVYNVTAWSCAVQNI